MRMIKSRLNHATFCFKVRCVTVLQTHVPSPFGDDFNKEEHYDDNQDIVSTDCFMSVGKEKVDLENVVT